MKPTKTKQDPTLPIYAGRTRQKQRTRQQLLDTAGGLLSAGQRPSVTEVADAAGVSRRTAYRYFPTAAKLHADAALDGLRPVMESAMQGASSGNSPADMEKRVAALAENMQKLALQNEMLLRTMIHETVLLPNAPATDQPRGGRRLEWIENALAPLRQHVGPASYRRLINALALCLGIESLLVLRDICGLTVKEAIRVSQWMCLSLVRESLSAAARKHSPTVHSRNIGRIKR